MKLTKENILAVISILAFIMSLLTWVHTWVCQRKRIRLSIIQYVQIDCWHILFMSIENLSRIPISISTIYAITENGKCVACKLIPETVLDITNRRGKEITSHEIRKSAQFPISISSLGGLSEYVVFEDHQNIFPIAPTEAIFQVCTNRGRAMKMKLLIGPPASPEEMF